MAPAANKSKKAVKKVVPKPAVKKSVKAAATPKVAVKKAGMPAPPARMRSARVPWGTSSSSILPARYSSGKTVELAVRGYEQIILAT